MSKSNFQRTNGMNYAPKGKAESVCEQGEFCFAVVGLDHGHIYGMCNGLIEAGAELTYVYDIDSKKVEAFLNIYPGTTVASSYEQILEDESIKMVACAAIPKDRSEVGIRAMRAGKDYFGDKTPVVSLAQLEKCKAVVAETGRKFMVYFSERLHVEGALYAQKLIDEGEIGEIIHMDCFGPHRLSIDIRPSWFFDPKSYGGILCDIGSHQIEQFLSFTGATDAKIDFARTANRNHPDHPDFEDFGEMILTSNNGKTAHLRLDWFTPDSLPVWGDGRSFIIGTKGYIEVRKYVNVGTQETSDHVFICNDKRCEHIEALGTVGFPFFGALIRDCLDRTENAMTQEHVFKTLEISANAQSFSTFGINPSK